MTKVRGVFVESLAQRVLPAVPQDIVHPNVLRFFCGYQMVRTCRGVAYIEVAASGVWFWTHFFRYDTQKRLGWVCFTFPSYSLL